MRLGEHLVRARLITPEDLATALEVQRYKRVPVGRLLRDLGHIDAETLDRELERNLKPRAIRSLKELPERTPLDERFGRGRCLWAEKRGAIPWTIENGRLVLLVANYCDETLLKAEEKFEHGVELWTVGPDLFAYLNSLLGGHDERRDSVQFTIQRALTDDEKISQSTPYTSLFREIVLHAKKLGASDVHLQPKGDGIDVRLRVFGELQTYKHLGVEHRQSFINEVKRLSNLQLATSGSPQDGSVHFENWKLKLRASLLPSQYGEKLVFRLLDLDRKFDLEQQNLLPEDCERLTQALSYENGVVVVSGPTGSGKTTTLYSLLCALDRKKKNIITLEDPVEYEIPGLTQTQVGDGLTFAEALRSVLRQDPDVILVGEIRDEETAKLCMAAGATGHLVLTTLHANSAFEVIYRFATLGVDSLSLKSQLRLACAQRLLPALCSKCALIAGPDVVARIKIPPSEVSQHFRVRNEAGCEHCQLGIRGMIPILESLGADDIEIQSTGFTLAKAQTLRDACVARAMRGEVDVREIDSL